MIRLVTVPSVEFNLARLIAAISEAHPDRVALVHKSKQISFPTFVERYRRFGSALNASGLSCRVERSELEGHMSGQDHVALFLNMNVSTSSRCWALGPAELPLSM